jgi:hypothetical protein
VKYPQVIMFSTTLGKWEIYQAGRPLAKATRHETLSNKFPDAQPVSEDQLRIEREHKEGLDA